MEYLEKSFGFSRDQAISAAKKLRSFKSTANPDYVLDLLITHGFDDAQIKSIVASFPSILLMSAERTLGPKITVLQELGLSQAELVKIKAMRTGILGKGLRSSIVPSINTMRSILGSNENVVKVIKKSVRVLGCYKLLERNIQLLRSRGMNDERIGKLMLSRPRIFTSMKSWLEGVIIRVEGTLGLYGDSMMFLFGMFALDSLNNEKLESKFGIFKSYGWDESHIKIMARINPITFTVSDAKIKNRLHFFMKELGYDPKFLAVRPSLLMHSMEKRVRPRIAVLQILKDKKLIKQSYSIYGAITKNESHFIRRFIEPYKQLVPNLHEVYINNMKAPAEAAVSSTSNSS